MAIKQTKVTDEELKQISEFQTSIDRITINLGQLSLKKLTSSRLYSFNIQFLLLTESKFIYYKY